MVDTMKKLLSTLALTFLLTVGWVSASEATETPPEIETPVCVGEIIGPGTATTNGHCVLVSYEYADGAPGPDQYSTSLPQDLFATDGDGETLTVALPDCFYQVDLLDASAVLQNPLTVPNYYGDNGWLIDAEHGGTDECETVITTTTTVPETTTTVPEVTTTVPQTTVPSTVTTNVVPPTTVVQELARTGVSDYREHLLVIMGLMIAGIGFIFAGEERRMKYR